MGDGCEDVVEEVVEVDLLCWLAAALLGLGGGRDLDDRQVHLKNGDMHAGRVEGELDPCEELDEVPDLAYPLGLLVVD